MCDIPTVKSYHAQSINYSGTTRAYLENDLVWFGYECGSFKFTPCDDLGLYYAFLLTDHSLGHVFLFKKGQFWVILFI